MAARKVDFYDLYSCHENDEENCECNDSERIPSSSKPLSNKETDTDKPKMKNGKQGLKGKIAISSQDDDDIELYRLPLADNEDQCIHTVVKTFRLKPYIHIRKYFRGIDRQGNSKWIPTKQGVVLKQDELKVLLKNADCIMHSMKST